MRSFERWVQYSGVDPDDWALALMTHLEGEALDFAQNLPDCDNYEVLADELRRNFASQAEKYYFELKSMRRNLGKPIGEYIREFNKIKNKAKGKLNSTIEIEIFISGLQPASLRERLTVNNPSTLDDAQRLAQRFEMLFVESTGHQNANARRALCKDCNKWHAPNEKCGSQPKREQRDTRAPADRTRFEKKPNTFNKPQYRQNVQQEEEVEDDAFSAAETEQHEEEKEELYLQHNIQTPQWGFQ